jgi:SAM-dependent methyltransferase
MPPKTPSEWNQRYRDKDIPWDSGIRSRELARVLQEQRLESCRAIELGCGSGTNVIFLARQGFTVTGVDCAPTALASARSRAAEAGVTVEFLEADLCRFDAELEPFDFLFDRGCYHCARQIDLDGFLATIARLSRPGSLYLTLTGNANDETDEHIPKVREDEFHTELGELFDFEMLREIHFEDAGGIEGPLGWSCLMRRKAT